MWLAPFQELLGDRERNRCNSSAEGGDSAALIGALRDLAAGVAVNELAHVLQRPPAHMH